MSALKLLADALQRELERRGVTMPASDCETVIRATFKQAVSEYDRKNGPPLVPAGGSDCARP